MVTVVVFVDERLGAVWINAFVLFLSQLHGTTLQCSFKSILMMNYSQYAFLSIASQMTDSYNWFNQFRSRHHRSRPCASSIFWKSLLWRHNHAVCHFNPIIILIIDQTLNSHNSFKLVHDISNNPNSHDHVAGIVVSAAGNLGYLLEPANTSRVL